MDGEQWVSNLQLGLVAAEGAACDKSGSLRLMGQAV